jgi:hypothetical protein
VSLIALVLIFGRAVFMMPLGNALGLMLAGGINIIGAVFYYKAIQKGDNIDVTIFGQVAPLMSIGLGVLLLGETINANQGLGFVMIMGATLLVIFGTSSKREKHSPNVDVALITIVYCFFSILLIIVNGKELPHFSQSRFCVFGLNIKSPPQFLHFSLVADNLIFSSII